MSRHAPNFIWRKRVTPVWLRENEARVNGATGGTHSIVEVPGGKRAQIEMFCEAKRAALDLVAAFGGAMEELPRDWHSRILASHRMEPLRIGRRLVVASEAGELDAAATLVIPAGAAFGTGDHATTAMSLRMLERVSRRLRSGWQMLDAGTGSGILALAGKRFGAGSTVAIDNDRTAIATARENARVNGIRGVKFIVGDVKALPPGPFDIITANLYSELLEATLPQFRSNLAEDGRLILSGVLRQQEPQLTKALKANHLRILEARRRGKWIALLAAPCPKT
jgi:ribosomal protein L11 methyltransferase